jgi:superfamily II DNA/RNA helicase
VLAYEPSAFDPAPILFDKLSLDERLLSGIRDLGWKDTRPVQSGVIPLALGGGDVIACAETGTGKTAAFLVPILQRFLNEQWVSESDGTSWFDPNCDAIYPDRIVNKTN